MEFFAVKLSKGKLQYQNCCLELLPFSLIVSIQSSSDAELNFFILAMKNREYIHVIGIFHV